jgi:hypothetical protein
MTVRFRKHTIDWLFWPTGRRFLGGMFHAPKHRCRPAHPIAVGVSLDWGVANVQAARKRPPRPRCNVAAVAHRAAHLTPTPAPADRYGRARLRQAAPADVPPKVPGQGRAPRHAPAPRVPRSPSVHRLRGHCGRIGPCAARRHRACAWGEHRRPALPPLSSPPHPRVHRACAFRPVVVKAVRLPTLLPRSRVHSHRRRCSAASSLR